MKKRKNELGAKIANELEMPVTAICNTFTIEFTGQNSIIIDGCKGVLEYGEDLLILNLGEIAVQLGGKKMQIVTFNEQQAHITGEVAAMEFIS